MSGAALVAFVSVAVIALPAAASAGNVRAVSKTELEILRAKTFSHGDMGYLPSPNLPERSKQMLSAAGYNALYGKWRQGLPDLIGATQSLQQGAVPLSESGLQLTKSKTTSLKPRRSGHVIVPVPTVNNKSLESSAFNTQSEPSIAITKGMVVIGYNSSSNFSGGSGLSGYSFSTDFGKTFTEVAGGLAPIGTIIPLGDPSLAVRLGVFYYATLALDVSNGDSYILVYSSTDGGGTFAPAFGVIATCSTPPNCDFLDKELIAIDRKSTSPFKGRLYITLTDFLAGGGTAIVSCAFTASTNTPLFCTSITTEAAQGSMPAIGPDGELYVAWEQFSGTGSPTGRAIFFSKSTDGGATFSAPAKISDVTPVLDAGATLLCGRPALLGGIRANNFPVIAVDTGTTSPFKGNVYVVWNDMRNGDADIFGTLSENGGVSWDLPVIANTAGAGTDQFFPWITVMRDGRIAGIWYDRRHDASNNWWIHLWMGESADAGETAIYRRVTKKPFPVVVNADALTAPCYMAEYNQITNNGVNWYMAFGDNSNGNPDVVFKRKVPKLLAP